ncbi:hypothetical protein MCA0752 [Methylococcus capsulatus str. Bath]|jgi:hypothetical protein|uniref:Neurotransmitter-gated ion-channel ligand-binding domain-containing protein n=1 Tax=Methylococcus capsulatus (strain ATCC 33009 / NCIMB 11132 / Bath) TaxID=243233 RepID=Q60AU2_METCA|nr:hypothetical protein [Methylococcus capsulatus]AAU92984.1 hypothetical protein MCA0752 [Methylococcus capsulatus str. Bath]
MKNFRNATIYKHGHTIVVCMLVTTLVLAVITVRSGILDRTDFKQQDQLIPVDASDDQAIPVNLGVYVENIYNFSPNQKTFDAEGWVWLTWPQAAQDIFAVNGIPSSQMLDFVNSVNGWDFAMTPEYSEPIRLPNGSYYQNFRYSGHFYANELNFRQFPFQTLRLAQTFELNSEDEALNAKHVRLIPDTAESGTGEYIDIMGYITHGSEIKTFIHNYGTNFGLADSDGEPTKKISQIRFEVIYKKSITSSILELFLPLVTVMALVMFAPMLSSSLWDVRLGLPPMVLLTLIFLQQGYKTELPDLPYVTFLDTIYNLCYLTTLILFCLFMWGSNKLDEASDMERAKVIAQINAMDLRFQIGLTIALIGLGTINWFVVGTQTP